MPDIKLFISCVSSEFGSYRRHLQSQLDRPNVTVKVQEDFIVTGTLTLEMLDDYISNCDGVIHLVGDMTGSMVKAQSLEAIQMRHPNLATVLPAINSFLDRDGPLLSYTHWEAWLALFHRRKLFIAIPEQTALRDKDYLFCEQQQAAQQEHLIRLRQMERYPGVHFRSPDNLSVGVFRSFVLDIMVKAGLSRRPSTLPLLPLANNLFQGRYDAMQHITELLGPIPSSFQTPPAVVALHGLGGVGKSRLAIEHAWRNAAHYAAVLFVAAETREALEKNLAALSGRGVLDLPEKPNAKQEEQKQEVIGWLQAHAGWLLILDGIDTPESAQEVIALVPHLLGGHVLLTSRLSRWSATVKTVKVNVLPLPEASAFLLQRTDASRRSDASDNENAKAIAEDLGRLPLALEQAGAYIDTQRLSLKRYRCQWVEKREKMLAWHDPMVSSCDVSVAATWLTSFDVLGEASRELLRIVSWLAPESVPENLLDTALPQADQEDILNALSELECYSLVNRSREEESFTVHCLVQEVGRNQQQREPHTNQLKNALDLVDRAFRGNPGDVNNWPELIPLASHACAVASFARMQEVIEPTGRLFNQLGLLWLGKGAYSDAKRLFLDNLNTDRAYYGNNTHKVARDLNNLAMAEQDLNRPKEALGYCHEALVIDENLHGDNHPLVATRLNNIATLRKQLGGLDQLKVAEAHLRKALEIDKKYLIRNFPDAARELQHRIEAILADAREQADVKPLPHGSRELKQCIASISRDLKNLAAVLQDQAEALKDKQKIHESLRIQEISLYIDWQVHGKNHPSTAITLYAYGISLFLCDKRDTGELKMREAVAIMLHRYGTDHPDARKYLANYGDVLRRHLRLPEADIQDMLNSLKLRPGTTSETGEPPLR